VSGKKAEHSEIDLEDKYSGNETFILLNVYEKPELGRIYYESGKCI
jgi:hypothetical protein